MSASTLTSPAALSTRWVGQMTQLRTALLNCVTPEDIVAIAQAMIKKAAEGSLGAAKLIYSYALGKPEASRSNHAETPALNPQPERKAAPAKPTTPEQEKSVEAVYHALYGDTPPSPNGNKRERKDARPLSLSEHFGK